jgi:hypothetical protein
MSDEEILNYLAIIPYDRDDRQSPDDNRRGQFIVGWNDSVVRDQTYTEETLKSLTWRNLGFRCGQHFGKKSEEEVQHAWEVLATQ